MATKTDTTEGVNPKKAQKKTTRTRKTTKKKTTRRTKKSASGKQKEKAEDAPAATEQATLLAPPEPGVEEKKAAADTRKKTKRSKRRKKKTPAAEVVEAPPPAKAAPEALEERADETTARSGGPSDLEEAERRLVAGSLPLVAEREEDVLERELPLPEPELEPTGRPPELEPDRAPTLPEREGERAERLRPRGRRGRRGRRGDRRAARDAPREDRPARDERPARTEKPVEARKPTAKPTPAAAGTEAGVREMMINVSTGEECRIAILHDGRLEELFIERESYESHVGNIYKGRVTNVEPSIQAVFVDFGFPKNGFLHISDVQPQYFPARGKGESEDIGRKTPRRSRPLIENCFRRGQEVIVQITKEGVGTKGPTLTTYLSIPGRFLVMMPGMNRHGVSRKIDDDAERRKMRDMMNELTLPSDMGFIMRTAGMGRSKRELQGDLNYLMRLWKTVVERIRKLSTPAELYRESDLVTRTIRDVYTSDFSRVVVDDTETAEKAREFLRIAMPRTKVEVEEYEEREPIFHHFGIEDEIDLINQRHVPLRSGGSLVIDSTEAMVAIDVNSGRFRSVNDAEESAFKINLEAAGEIARQLRLRDLGGLIVCDFIDLREERHKRAVERALRDALKSHKERARILRMSAFGLIEVTRQRQRPSIKRNIYDDCQHCKGTGLVKMPESVALDVMRIMQLATHHDQVQRVTITVADEVAYRLLNRKRAIINEAETETGTKVTIEGNRNFASDQVEYRCEDSRGQPVELRRRV